MAGKSKGGLMALSRIVFGWLFSVPNPNLNPIGFELARN
jgi:hypothetical protein